MTATSATFSQAQLIHPSLAAEKVFFFPVIGKNSIQSDSIDENEFVDRVLSVAVKTPQENSDENTLGSIITEYLYY